VIDPILRFFCCGWSPLHNNKIFKRQKKSVEKAEERVVAELEVFRLLGKVRDSYDMTKNMIDKETRRMLTFSKQRIIDIDSQSDTTSSDNVSDSKISMEEGSDTNQEEKLNANDFNKEKLQLSDVKEEKSEATR